MKDLLSGREIDIQGLLDMARYAEEAEHFDMSLWRNTCGTAGCLVGTFCMRRPEDALGVTYISGLHVSIVTYNGVCCVRGGISLRFGISEEESRFLFSRYHLANCPSNRRSPARPATFSNREQAVARLRKFIYYKMHRAELSYDEARQTGDARISEKVDQLLLRRWSTACHGENRTVCCRGFTLTTLLRSTMESPAT
jgi:hypothetical protein